MPRLPLRLPKRTATFALIPLAAIGLAACGSTVASKSSGQTAPAGGATANQIDPQAPSTIAGADPAFNYSALVWQGYWLSRDELGPFTMGSGMGEMFKPDMKMIGKAIEMVSKNPNDRAEPPANAAPLRAIYKSGSPKLENDPTKLPAGDLAALRLDPATFDKTVAVRGQAETMLKESQWAHSFADSHFGEPDSDFGAQQRFTGIVMAMMAKMQGQYAMQKLRSGDGLYHDSDGNLDYTANWVLLHTLSDIAGLTGETNGRYADPDAHPKFAAAATALLEALEKRTPASAAEAAAAVRALAYLASTTADESVEADALAKLNAVATGGALSNPASTDPVEVAAAIAGLVSAGSATSSGDYQRQAESLLDRLQADFDPRTGIFTSKNAYSADDVAWIIGGLNSLSQVGDRKGDASRMLLAFYEATLSLGGMQLSAPPGKDGAGAAEFEKELPSAVYYHPKTTPSPDQSGLLPVAAKEIKWDGKSWSVTDETFVPGQVMHLANEMNWLGPHLGANPFPLAGAAAGQG